MANETERKRSNNIDKVRCRIVDESLEICSDEITYYHIEQENYCLLELDDIPDNCKIKITAEWGPAPYHLTTSNRAKKILCQVGYGWEVAFFEEETEIYWLLTRTKAMRRYEAHLYVRFSNLTVYNEGVARLMLSLVENDQEGPLTYVQLKKRQCPLRIACFEPEEGTVSPPLHSGDTNATLCWCVLGAERCVLNPGNIEVRPVGRLPVSVTKNSVFTLSAFSQKKSVEKSTIIYTYEEIGHDLFSVAPHQYYLNCSTVIRWKLLGNVSHIQLWSGQKQIQKDLPPEGEMTNKDGAPEYTLSFLRGEERVDLCYERRPNEREAVLQFQVSYDERLDTFCVQWKTFKVKKSNLLAIFRKESDTDEEKFQFVNRHELITISSSPNGEAFWSLEHDKAFPVIFLLRVTNSYGEEIEKHAVYKG